MEQKMSSTLDQSSIKSESSNIVLILVIIVIAIFVVFSLMKFSYNNGFNAKNSEIENKASGNNGSSVKTNQQKSINEQPTKSNDETNSGLFYSGNMPNILLKINGNIFTSPNPLGEPQPTSFIDESKIEWTDISANFSEITPNDILFDYALNPNNTVGQIAFITKQPITLNGTDKTIYKVFVYSLSDKKGKLLTTSDNFSEGKIFRIDSFDMAGKIIILNGMGCWGCGGHPPRKYLLNTTNGNVKNLGVVQELSCLDFECTKYKFKMEEKIDCAQNGITSIPMSDNNCYKDMEKVPFQYGNL